MTYFKAVRPDGTDFYSGLVDYAALCGTGGELPRLYGPARLRTSGVYHASTEAGETLLGGSWPCRLFLVTGHEVASEGAKRGFRTLKVVQETTAHRALGSNGEEVAEFLARTSSLTAPQHVALQAEVRALSTDERRLRTVGEAYHAAEAKALDSSRYAAMTVARSLARRVPCWGALYSPNHALRYAVTALVVRDLLSRTDFRALYSAWGSVMDPRP